MNIISILSQVLGLAAVVALIWLVVRAFKRHIIWGFAVLFLSPLSATVFGIKYWRDEKRPFLAYITTFATALSLGLYLFSAWGGWDLTRAAFRLHQGIQSQALTREEALGFMHASLNFIENSGIDEQEQKKLDLMRNLMAIEKAGMNEADRQEMIGEVLELMEDEKLSEIQRNELDVLREQLLEEEDNEKDDTVTDAATPAPAKPVRKARKNYRLTYVPIQPDEAANYVGNTVKVTRKNSLEKQCLLIGTSPGTLRFEQRGQGGTFSFELKHHDIEMLKVLKRQAS